MTEDIAAIIAAPSDTHTGATMGLSPQHWLSFDGRIITHNALQEIIYRQWLEDWQRVAELRLTSKTWPRLIVIHVGDAVDGDHHETSELITARIDEQERMHIKVMDDALHAVGFDTTRGDELNYLAGSEAHAGEGASSEERIVRALLNDNISGGTYAHRVLRRRINGVLIHATHHGPAVGSRIYNRSNPLRTHLTSEYYNWLECGESVPRFYLCGHRHQFAHATIENQLGKVVIDGFVLPSFCFKGDYAQVVAPDSRPNIGMWLGIIHTDGTVRWECNVLSYRQEPIVEDAHAN